MPDTNLQNGLPLDRLSALEARLNTIEMKIDRIASMVDKVGQLTASVVHAIGAAQQEVAAQKPKLYIPGRN